MSCEIYAICKNKRMPRVISDYSQWLSAEIDRTEPSLRDDSSILRKPLRAFYRELLLDYPALNGRDRTEDDALIDKAVDYCFTHDAIEVSCGLSQADQVYKRMSALARKHGLCLYSVNTFEIDSTPRRAVERHCADDYPSVFKAFVKSLLTPIILFAMILGVYYLIKLLPHPYYSPLNYIHPWMVIILALAICTYVLVLGIRNERKGRRYTCDIDR